MRTRDIHVVDEVRVEFGEVASDFEDADVDVQGCALRDAEKVRGEVDGVGCFEPDWCWMAASRMMPRSYPALETR
ncbi:hypothetical protein A0H81_10654 [Grifola frondosa]|uniref:Uncharacterized protein n=1 Tax=Grifola frondosa TaxID=5627 RepID=A0A1C7M2W9_GRIFR|nr:hypothetical protein A0H81_10654 [Grifola frondosa]